MRTAIVMLMLLAFVGTAVAADLGSDRPVKDNNVQPYDPANAYKQGGDTIFDATVIGGLPYYDTGTTAGYAHDYDEICPYSGSTAPDVVYTFTPTEDVVVLVDLCGSSYDTKVYVYDAGLALVGCNDDFYFSDPDCGNYTSAIENLPLLGGMQYYIIVDGYGGDFGDYILNVEGFEPCVFDGCHPDAVLEGEPHLYDGYEDLYNGGCNSSPDGVSYFQEIDWINDDDGDEPYDPGIAWMCGRSGWFVGSSGGDTRDTDWFLVTARTTGVMEFTCESEYPTYMFKLAPLDCATVGVELQAIADCDAPATLAFAVTAGEQVWLWIGPTTYTGPVLEYDYFMTVSNNVFDVVPTEEMSFGGVKALYR